MAVANQHYYATRDPFGVDGDFVTAPEISQMFGELIGLWSADLWLRAGRPRAHYVELGPGRGTLAADARRAMATAGLAPDLHLVETSPVLREQQATRVPDARWHDDVASLPDDAALLVVANEFFDALPIRQMVRATDCWRERVVTLADDQFRPAAGPPHPPPGEDAPVGSIVELAPEAASVMRALSRRVAAQGGAVLVIDYGYQGPAVGDTLQAVARHGYADPFADPGERDLTAHVDFASLAQAAAGLRSYGPVGQGGFLAALGIAARAEMLVRGHPKRVQEIAAARDRLVEDEQMGRLFKAMALVAPGWPAPAGFGP